MMRLAFFLIGIFIGFLIGVFATVLPGKSLRVKKSPRGGRGVYATGYFRKGDLIEKCHLIVANDDDWGLALSDYIFSHGESTAAIPFGNGLLYNHDDDPNTDYVVRDKFMTITAARDIRPGEEIFVSYGDDWWTTRTHIRKVVTD